MWQGAEGDPQLEVGVSAPALGEAVCRLESSLLLWALGLAFSSPGIHMDTHSPHSLDLSKAAPWTCECGRVT